MSRKMFCQLSINLLLKECAVWALFFVVTVCRPQPLAAQPRPGKIDSLEQVLKTAAHDTTRFAAYHELFLELKKYDSDANIKKCAAQFAAAAQRAGDAYFTAQAFLDLADIDFDSADFHLEKVLYFARQVQPQSEKTQRFEAMAQLYKGDNFYYIGEYDKALEHLRLAEQKMPDDLGKAAVFSSLGQVLAEQSKQAEALGYFQKAREIGLKTGNKYLQAKSLKYIGDIYETLGDGKQSIECLQKAQAIYAEINNRPGVMASLASIAWVFARVDSTLGLGLENFKSLLKKGEEAAHVGFQVWAKNGMAHCYFGLGEVEKALDFGNQALRQSKGLSEENYMKWNILPTLSKIYNRKKDYAKALQCAQEAQAAFEKSNATDSQISQSILFQMAHAQIGLGDIEAGWQNLERYEQRDNELNLAKVKDEIARAEAKFRVNESEFALAESQRANQLQVEKTAAQRNFFLLLLAAAGLFLAFGFLAFRRAERDKRLISNQKAQLQQSLSEKETLLKEIHHRVKNNLQIISGLLEKQARKATDEMTKQLMREGQDRVFSMALVHQNLYQSDNLSAIEIKSYLEALTKNIKASQAPGEQKIEVKLDVDDSVLDVDTAIPVALILNELITNSFKYAFRGRSAGEIWVDFHQQASEFFLRVRDNGIGLPEGFDISKSKSLGLNLVRGLVEQLEGEFDFGNSQREGAFFEISFAKN